MKKVFNLFLILLILLIGISCKENKKTETNLPSEASEPTKTTEKEGTPVPEETEYTWDKEMNMVLFGDSLGAGYGIIRRSDYFASIFSKKINYKCANLAVSGDTSAACLRIVKNYEKLSEANLVIVEIGSNDILKPVSYYFLDISVEVLTTFSTGDKEKVKELCLKINEKVNDSEILDQENQGVENYTKNMREILDYILENNKEACIFVQNYYNPFETFYYEEDGQVYLNIRDMASTYIDRLNELLDDFVLEYKDKGMDIHLVDVYSTIHGHTDEYIKAHFSIVASEFQFDPHPNVAGHKKISEIYYDLWKSIYNK